MTTYTAGRLRYSSIVTESSPRIVNFMTFRKIDSLTPNLPAISLNNESCINFREVSQDTDSKMCLYNPDTIRDGVYSGNLYLLPVDKRMVPGDVDLGDQLTLVRTFTLIRWTSGVYDIWDGYYGGRKIDFYIPRNELPLCIIQAILIKTFGGMGTFGETIAPILYDDIPLNYSDQGTGDNIDSNIKGNDMRTYKLPWYKAGASSSTRENEGRPLDWSKTAQDNGLAANETIFCKLLRPGNKLTAYPGAAAPDWSDLGVSALIDILTTRITSLNA